MQTHKQSWIEGATNAVIAYMISVLVQAILFPLYDMHITLFENVQIVGIFTFISVVRNYIIRRYFNWKHAT